MSTNSEYAKMTIAKLVVEASAQNQRFLERMLYKFKSILFIIHGTWNALKCISKLPLKASAQIQCCLERKLFELESFVIQRSRNALK